MITDKNSRRRMVTVILLELLAAVITSIASIYMKLPADHYQIVVAIIALCLTLAVFEGVILYIHTKGEKEEPVKVTE